MTSSATEQPPARLRRLDGASAAALVDLTTRFEDLQTVLRCCERLVLELDTKGEPDGVVIEALWTTTLLSYTRCFQDGDAGPALNEDDLTTIRPHDDIVNWHKVLLRLRDHYADRKVNPRERFSVGVAQDADGVATGIAITSTRQPLVDDVTVRQTGRIAYALAELVDGRIAAQQALLFGELKDTAATELDQLDQLEVVATEPRQ